MLQAYFFTAIEEAESVILLMSVPVMKISTTYRVFLLSLSIYIITYVAVRVGYALRLYNVNNATKGCHIVNCCLLPSEWASVA